MIYAVGIMAFILGCVFGMLRGYSIGLRDGRREPLSQYEFSVLAEGTGLPLSRR